MGKAMLTIMAAFAQLERDTMIERTRAGLAAAAANGRKGGRPRKVDDAAAIKARSLREKGINATDIAKMLGSRAPPCTATSLRMLRRLPSRSEMASVLIKPFGWKQAGTLPGGCQVAPRQSGDPIPFQCRNSAADELAGCPAALGHRRIRAS